MTAEREPKPLSDYAGVRPSALLSAWDAQAESLRDQQLASVSRFERVRSKHRGFLVLLVATPVLVGAGVIGFVLAQPSLEKASWCGSGDYKNKFSGISSASEREEVEQLLLECGTRKHNEFIASITSNDATLQTLAEGDATFRLLEIVAENENASPETLEMLSKRVGGGPATRRIAEAIIENSKSRDTTIIQVIQNNPELTEDALLNSSISDSVKKQIMREMDFNFGEFAALAKSSNITLKMMVLDLGSPTTKFRRDVALHTSDPELLNRLASDSEAAVREVVARKSTLLSDDVRTAFASDPNIPVRAALAGVPELNFQLSKLLASDDRANVRIALAKGTQKPKVLSLLAKDENSQVRRAVALNRYATNALLRDLASDDTKSVADAANLRLS